MWIVASAYVQLIKMINGFYVEFINSISPSHPGYTSDLTLCTVRPFCQLSLKYVFLVLT